MWAMVLEQIRQPLLYREIPDPVPGPNQVLIRVNACGVCRTDLHVVDGELAASKRPLVPGHQIVGTVEALGPGSERFRPGDRIGVPWLGGSCGQCNFCLAGRENLCDHALYTGYQIDGGFAEKCIAHENFCFPIPKDYSPLQAAPLLCAGLIGYRALRMTDNAESLGFYGFGSSAHILTQVARYLGKKVYAFTRPGDTVTQKFAEECGAVWAGGSDQAPPQLFEAAIIFAPAGELVPVALRAVGKGGVVVCAGIHMSDIPSFPYSILWEERVLRSVANLTRYDGEDFLSLAPKVPVHTTIHPYPLEKTNEALADLREGKFTGSAVIQIE
jgi:alcohol dehydrogenase, propanol-preferring